MGAAPSIVNISAEEYLRTELESPVRREYLAGATYAMAGGSERHNLITLNIATVLRSHLKGGPCRTFVSDMKLGIHAAGVMSFYYPDVMVVCDPSDDAPLVKTKPTVIFEVLSPNTASIDKREKRLVYLSSPSLKEYVLVEQSRPETVIYRSGAPTQAEVVESLDAVIEIKSVGISLSLRDVYADLPNT